MRQRSAVQLFLLCTGIAVMIALSQVRAISAYWGANRANVNSLSQLLGQHPTADVVIEATTENGCDNYIKAVQVLRSTTFQKLPPESQLQLLERYESCLPEERRQMLTGWRSSALWAQGQFDAACDLLVTTNAPDQLLKLAQQAEKDSSWAAVEAALGCIQRFDPDGPWVSPYIVSQLYYALGVHFEQIQATDEAIGAFDDSARWFPVVWSAPYTKKAALLWSQGDHAGTIDWLVGGLSRSVDVTATYNLWHALGDYWLQVEELDNAYCAYQAALDMIDQVPPENIAPGDQDRLIERVHQLEAIAPAECSSDDLSFQ